MILVFIHLIPSKLTQNRAKYGLSAHTLRLPGLRIYVLNKASLINTAQKQRHALSFGPIMSDAIGRIAGTSKITNGAISKDLLTDDGFLLGFNKAVYHTISPGSSLKALTTQAAITFLNRIDTLQLDMEGKCRVSLSAWIRSTILQGTTDAVYGASNPFRDPIIERAWYSFEPGVTSLALRIIPAFATRKTRQARATLVESFTEYFTISYPKGASDFMKARYNHIIRHGITNVRDIAKLEVAGAFSIITNSAPTALWLLYHIFSNPIALKDCRLELAPLIHERSGVCYLDTESVKILCPILHSTLHEVLRYYGVAQSVRAVVEDHKLDNVHLLKKGGLVMMPSTVQHFDQAVWGSDVDCFDHRRFLPMLRNIPTADANISMRTAFRGFGGGQQMCPGRHFAVTEILSLVALMVLRLDIIPVNDGQWPPMDINSAKGSAVIIPDDKLDVYFVLRDRKTWALL
ncbi:cytochrome P450 [Aaosphaeria arxii CBS 175.79]|uniref:Cytochrome P450 n=1 Tax=Aaosphaeria arxii CBS 175.79 TaxID=1450172 RepID=A0A6A5X8S0_9PLEO|nr:cytochrome P450 [Aaosphaeria arxii CBS 175.79]KAF2009352.1 cytochrome P450 [Aaosphaeria arxii CBS 175.79]